jgi:ComF family protein
MIMRVANYKYFTHLLSRLRQAAGASRCALLELLYPPGCPLCGVECRGAFGLCADCFHGIQQGADSLCPRCAMPTTAGRAESSSPRDCPRCRCQSFYFSSAVAIGPYRGTLKDAILRIKREEGEALAGQLGVILATLRAVPLRACRPHLVVPLPSYWTRRLSRGITPAALLAEAVAKTINSPLAFDVLACRRPTKKQGTLSPAERRLNVRQAFRASRSYDLQDTCVLLVDDVMTTGATMNEAARVLRRAGASRVVAAVVARGTG